MKPTKSFELNQSAHTGCIHLNKHMQLIDHMIDFCQAIGFTHSKGIIHRVINAENVLIEELGQTIVLDWGLVN